MKKEEREVLDRALPVLIEWYRANKKSMPWREDPSPYHVWISEIMLQQTRIEAVIPYYRRFLSALPDIAALAAVEEEKLLKLWEGLGYYSRARNLKKAAVIVMEKYDGELPHSPAELQKQPGIGAYTAGAIASIAFGEPAPAVDGNVLRVYARLCAMDDDIMKDTTRKRVTAALSEVYPRGQRAALLTEALMELGEVICIPNGEPLCHLCSMASFCQAYLKGLTECLPIRSAPKARRVEKRTVFLLEHQGAYAICRRPEKGLLAGLWEFPNREGWIKFDDVESILVLQGYKIHSLEEAPAAQHIFTHVEWQMRGVLVHCENRTEEYVWKTPDEIIASAPLPKAFHFYLKYIQTC